MSEGIVTDSTLQLELAVGNFLILEVGLESCPVGTGDLRLHVVKEVAAERISEADLPIHEVLANLHLFFQTLVDACRRKPRRLPNPSGSHVSPTKQVYCRRRGQLVPHYVETEISSPSIGTDIIVHIASRHHSGTKVETQNMYSYNDLMT